MLDNCFLFYLEMDLLKLIRSSQLFATHMTHQNFSRQLETQVISDLHLTLGFSAYWVAGPPIVCGRNLNGSSGIIQSPNFPSDYPDFSLCEWTITVDNGTTVYLELLAFDLENCCGCDYIEIR